MRGQYRFIFADGSEQVIRNTVVDEGSAAFLAALFQNAAITFYVGLCSQVPTDATVLTDITTEPTIGVGAYARIALARDGTDWPTIDTLDGVPRVVSKTVTFTATGANFDLAFSRAFLCTVASGAGTLLSVSGSLTSAVTLVDGTSFSVQYELFLD